MININKIISLALLSIILCVFITPNSILADEINDPIGVNSSTFYCDTENGGDILVNLAIENTIDHPIDVKIENWYNYKNPDEETQNWIQPEWLISIDPSEITLPVGGKTITNVLYNIPEEAEELKYITWIKVDVEGWQKPITVVIRKGVASEVIDFGVYPAYYRLLVDSYDANITIKENGSNEYTDWTPIVIKNKSGAYASIYAEAEDRGKILTISSDSVIKHTDNEVGLIYKNITTEQAQSWFSSLYTKENPLEVNPHNSQDLEWSLSIPDNIKNGHYVFGVRIASTNSRQDAMNVNYLIWFLVDVDRHSSHFPWFIIITTISVVLIITVFYIVTRKIAYSYKKAKI